MNSRHLLVLAFLGAGSSLGAFACTTTTTTTTIDDAGVRATPITSDYALRDDMRQLWEEHVTWTRVYLIAAIGGLPDAAQAATRLFQNQIDMGNAIKPFYGNAAGEKLTGLLTDHIAGAVEVVTAAKAGDAAKLATAKTAWYANADQIAAFLASANPNWPAADLTMMMHMHLDQTLAEATARLTGDWTGDVVSYDLVVDHIIAMADALSAGITKQFPDKVSVSTTSRGTQELHRGMRKLWLDHVMWTRFFLMDAIAGLPGTPQTTARLLQNQVDMGAAIKPYYGEAAGDRLATLLHDHIVDAAAVVDAAKAGDATRVANAKTVWYANADEIATFLANANPNWSATDLKGHMRAHLDETLAEATARLTADWNADITSYDAVEHHILMMAGVLSDGINKQFPNPIQ